jgi:hypothetical protein
VQFTILLIARYCFTSRPHYCFAHYCSMALVTLASCHTLAIIASLRCNRFTSHSHLCSACFARFHFTSLAPYRFMALDRFVSFHSLATTSCHSPAISSRHSLPVFPYRLLTLVFRRSLAIALCCVLTFVLTSLLHCSFMLLHLYYFTSCSHYFINVANFI